MAPWSLDDQFVKAVHTALKQLRRERELGEHLLTRLTAVEERRRQDGWPDMPLGRAAALRGVLVAARQDLAAQDDDAATLLERRFWQDKSVVRIAHEQHVAESTLYARQEQAICMLARGLWALEQVAQEQAGATRRHLIRNLPPPTYTRLFGFDEVFGRLCAALTDQDGPWLVSIEGLGGLGKTALAHRLAAWAADQSHPLAGSLQFRSGQAGHGFADIAWETAQQQRLATWSEIERPRVRMFLTFESLLDSIAVQLGYAEIPRQPLARKQALLQTILKERPYLVVVDNLETAADPHALIPQLWEMANPSRFLLTTRYSLGDHPGVSCLTLNELSEADSPALMRYEGKERGVTAIAGADDAALRAIYTVTGGNPLAIKLVIGQARGLPIERVLAGLQGAVGQCYEDLYRYIYWRSWELLSDSAQQTLLAMPALAASGGYWENLLAVCGLPPDDLERAIQELLGMSLLTAAGADAVPERSRAGERCYAIHQLTYNFLMSDLLTGEAG
ncbi:MAG: hypothetical protein KJ734_06760 [Chloroflexi bacterium]|nr:hypothetical protein [Chloroflexota bacterium]